MDRLELAWKYAKIVVVAILKYVGNVLYALDQLLNALLGGDPNETLSSRMGKHVSQGRCVLCKHACWLLDKIDKNHCFKHIERVEIPGERDIIK